MEYDDYSGSVLCAPCSPQRHPPHKSLNRTFRRFDPSSILRLLSEETENDEEDAGLTGRSDTPGHVWRVRCVLPDRPVPMLPVQLVQSPGAMSASAGADLLSARADLRGAAGRHGVPSAVPGPQRARVPAGRVASNAAIRDAGPNVVRGGCPVQHLPGTDDGADGAIAGLEAEVA